MESIGDKPAYIMHKKVLLFGCEASGKTTFSNVLKTGSFKENIAHTEEGKYIIKFTSFNYSCPRKSDRIQIKRREILEHEFI